jgi:transcriptional regulator NrdR family protein
MNCPKCGALTTKITSSYRWRDGLTVTRHRLCRADGCWLRFKTRERPMPSSAYVVPRPMPRRARIPQQAAT